MVEKIEDYDQENKKLLSRDEKEKKLGRQQAEPFMRGAMNFEDYNYKFYNPFILVPPVDVDTQDVKFPGDFKPQQVFTKKAKQANVPDQGGHDIGTASLTSKILEENFNENYDHESVDIKTDNEKQQEAEKKKQERIAAEIHRQEMEEKKKLEAEQDKESDEGQEK